MYNRPDRVQVSENRRANRRPCLTHVQVSRRKKAPKGPASGTQRAGRAVLPNAVRPHRLATVKYFIIPFVFPFDFTLPSSFFSFSFSLSVDAERIGSHIDGRHSITLWSVLSLLLHILLSSLEKDYWP